MRWLVPLFLGWVVFGACLSVRADVFGSGTNAFAIDFVNIGNTRNVADTNGVGSVPYHYRISTYEISQDAISRATASGLFGVTAGAWASNRPAAQITWLEAAAFVNWLNTTKGHQPAYNLTYTNGAWSMEVWGASEAWTSGGTNLYRHKNARYFITSENEWYKAAYYNPSASNFFLYATGNNTPPLPIASGAATNTAVFSNVAAAPAPVNSAGGLSPNGTMGQGGNVVEWMETDSTRSNTVANAGRLIRGGAWDSSDYYISSEGQFGIILPFGEFNLIGFRVASTSDVYNSLQLLAEAATKWPFDPATASNWATGGDGWSVDLAASRDGVDSVKAKTTNGQSTYRQYTVTGPAVVDFWWKVSSEQIYDTFSYSLNGVNQETISGEVDWTYRTLNLPVGTHTIRWTYSKDVSDAVGQDAGWLDDLAVHPAEATLQVRDADMVLNGDTTLDFGSVDVGSAGPTKSLNFVNEGYVSLEVQLSLPEGSPFTFNGGAATYSLFLGRGESMSVPITLSTTVRGTKTAQLTISAPDSTATPPQITLTGEVVGPVIGVKVGDAPVASGQTVDLGLAPRIMQFTISNTGNVGNLEISSVSATGSFQITQQAQMSIAPQGSTTFAILAQSGASGVQSGTITIVSNDYYLETFTVAVISKALFSIGESITADSVSTSGTGGAVGWDFATTQLPSGQSGQALKTGATPNAADSVLEFTAQDAGVVSWSWKVSAQENFDWLLCEVDGKEVAGISTKNGVWQTQVVQVPAGANVRWVYRKDGSASAGEDAGYLADVEFRGLTANQSFNQWAQIHGITNPQKRTAKGTPAVFAWLGSWDPAVGPNAGHHVPFMEGGFLKYRFPISKTADGTQRIQFSSDLATWVTRRFSQRIVDEDANRMVIEATAPIGKQGFFRTVGAGDTSVNGMVYVQSGLLPSSSALAGAAISAFRIGRCEVSWDEWREVREWAVTNGYGDLADVGAGSAGNHPVRNVSWYDAVKWSNAKSEKEGLVPVYSVGGVVYRTGQSGPTLNGRANGYRLPTEAEWEWAARGGTGSRGYVYSGSNDANAVAWNYDNSVGSLVDLYQGRGTWPVATKSANELGIYDMSGNVWEWCENIHPLLGRYIRGGAWDRNEYYCTVSYRDGYGTRWNNYNLGFRVARNAD